MPDWARLVVAGGAIAAMIWLLSRVGLAGVFLGLEGRPPTRRKVSGQRTIGTAVLAIAAVIILILLFSAVVSR